jgi:transposase
VPDQEDEAIRDLIRARTSAMMDQRKARNRLKGFLLRLGFRYTGKSSWTDAHKRYLSGLLMPQPPQQIVFQEYIHATDDASDRLQRLNQAVEAALPGWKWEPVVRALMSLRGVQVLSAKTRKPRMHANARESISVGTVLMKTAPDSKASRSRGEAGTIRVHWRSFAVQSFPRTISSPTAAGSGRWQRIQRP